MLELYRKEEIEHIDNIPAKILHQQLAGTECSVSMHWHKHIEIDMMLSGDAEFTVDGDKRLLRPGDFIIINSGDVHMGTAPSKIPLKDRYQELITILWDYDFLHRYVEHLPVLRFEMPQSETLMQKIRALILTIDKAYMQKALCFEMEITSALLQIGCILLNHCVVREESLQTSRIKSNSREIQQAVSHIEENCRKNLTLSEVAAYMGFSPEYFSKKFKQLTGVTFHDYLIYCRIRNSLKDIQNTNLSMTDIAYRNGFPNVKSFIAYFKKTYNTTPLKYRNKRH